MTRMYRPPVYAQDDVSLLHRIIRERSFATIATIANGDIGFSYAPVVLDGKTGDKGGVRFHLAKANPMSELDGALVRLSFLGPDAYVSPDWYVSKGLVPTWNYIAVEASGVAKRLDDAALVELLVDLSADQEEHLRPKTPWTIDKVPADRMKALLAAIVGFSVSFETLEGKFKLSQDKKTEDFEGVVAALHAEGPVAIQPVAAAMRMFGRPKG
jgi:transcriptional regulator